MVVYFVLVFSKVEVDLDNKSQIIYILFLFLFSFFFFIPFFFLEIIYYNIFQEAKAD